MTNELIGIISNEGELKGVIEDNSFNGTNIPVSTNKRTARFVVGTSTSGWTEKDCDYLCDGTADQVEINNANCFTHKWWRGYNLRWHLQYYRKD